MNSQSFSTEFLFIKGDHNPRHNGAQLGELYPIEAIFIILGLLYLYKNYKRELNLFGGWLLIAPIPTALISEPHALRSSLMLAPLVLISGSGFYYFWSILFKNVYTKILLMLFLLLLIFEFSYFTERNYFLSANLYGDFFARPAKEASLEIEREKNNYSYVLVSDKIDAIELAYPVYTKLDPNIVIAQNLIKSQLNGINFKKYGNVYIGYIPISGIEEFTHNLSGTVLYVGSKDDINYLRDFEVRNSGNSIGYFLKKYN